MSLIYEVHIRLPEEIWQPFSRWLDEHVEQMRQLPYFTEARIFACKALENGERSFKVHYFLRDRSALDEYLKIAAPQMRNQIPGDWLNKVVYARALLETSDSREPRPSLKKA